MTRELKHSGTYEKEDFPTYQVPLASSREEGAPSLASWEGLPYGVLASYQGEEDPLKENGAES